MYKFTKDYQNNAIDEIIEIFSEILSFLIIIQVLFLLSSDFSPINSLLIDALHFLQLFRTDINSISKSSIFDYDLLVSFPCQLACYVICEGSQSQGPNR